MMQRRWWYRATGACLAAVYLVGSAVEAAGANDCPHHGRRAVALALVAPHHAPAAGHHPPAGSGPAHHGPCTCVGDCSGGPAAPALSVSHTLLPQAIEHTVPAPAAAMLARTSTPHRLPFAQGPPELRIA